MEINQVHLSNSVVEHNGLRLSQGILSAIAFSLLLAGTNSITPLLPLYSADLGFDHLALSPTFVVYVGVLVVVLLALTRPSITRLAPVMLCSALVLALVSDWILSTTDEQMILIGRGVAGLAGGLGTSSAAVLVVSALGAVGRSVSATGNVIGAVFGTAFSQVCVELFSQNAMHLVFVFHAYMRSKPEYPGLRL
ncbi:hypothetical protein [Pseudomonas syringae]|uniref:hypothetical protein n=1 Tax=Pseudomonas syringae TaxID=317 RepID=UPI000BB65966|nr:hypothetical protein [Pseudomonas syringae]PBP46180.1 hypothetical protein CCL13_12335 [Pseudomonas syringae]